MERNMLHSKNESRNVSNIKNVFKKITIFIIAFCMIFNYPLMVKVSRAEIVTAVNVKIDYVDEMAYVTAGTGGSTKFYFSTDQKTWEMLDSNTLDISSLLSSKQITVYFKGNKDTYSSPIILPAEDKTFTAAYTIVDGVGRIQYTSALAIEYRKGSNGAWKTAYNSMLTAPYELKGATLYFRTVAIAATGVNAGTRAGKIVSVKIPKRPAAPSVKVDGSKLCISGLKSGVTQYRVGDTATWTTFMALSSSNKNSLELTGLFGGSTTSNVAIPAGIIELRTSGAGKKLNSATKVLEIPMQRIISSTAVSVTGSALSITDGDSKNAYEYTIVAYGQTVNMYTAKWKSVSSNKSIIIPNVAKGDKVLVRLKSTTNTLTKQVIPASTYFETTITAITPK